MAGNKIIDGKEFSAVLRDKIKKEVSALRSETGKTPGLAVVLVGNDPASEVYVRNKDKQAKETGMNSFEYKMPATVSEKELIAKVNELNNDDKVHGILVQLPLPKHISEDAVIDAISYKKDVDGFHPINRGHLVAGIDSLVPCTPLGCLMLIKDRLGVIAGMNAVVIGRSNIVGKPMSQLLLNEGCTVTVCHSKTKDIKDFTSKADILVVAVGKPQLVKKDWVKKGACVIDVGINRIEANATNSQTQLSGNPSASGSAHSPTIDPSKTNIKPLQNSAKLVGDVNYEDVFETAGFITPVPGGVGPMTIACLLDNTLKAFRKIENLIR